MIIIDEVSLGSKDYGAHIYIYIYFFFFLIPANDEQLTKNLPVDPTN